MSIAVIFILYFGIKRIHFQGDTGEWQGQYHQYQQHSNAIPENLRWG